MINVRWLVPLLLTLWACGEGPPPLPPPLPWAGSPPGASGLPQQLPVSEFDSKRREDYCGWFAGNVGAINQACDDGLLVVGVGEIAEICVSSLKAMPDGCDITVAQLEACDLEWAALLKADPCTEPASPAACAAVDACYAADAEANHDNGGNNGVGVNDGGNHGQAQWQCSAQGSYQKCSGSYSDYSSMCYTTPISMIGAGQTRELAESDAISRCTEALTGMIAACMGSCTVAMTCMPMGDCFELQ